MRASRASLSDEAFCRRSGLDASLASLVFSIRSKLVSFGGYDPLRVYPEDRLSHHLHLHHEHHVAMVVEDMNIRRGYDNESFSYKEVDTVADFVRVVWRLKKEAESGDSANGREHQSGTTFRLAVGRCSCAEPQRDTVRQAVCRDLVKRLDVLRGMDTGELLRLPRYSRAVARIEGRSVRFETIRERYPGEVAIVMVRAFFHTWWWPTWISFHDVGHLFADGFILRNDGEKETADNKIMWQFR